MPDAHTGPEIVTFTVGQTVKPQDSQNTGEFIWKGLASVGGYI